jgi:hypothetical protein
MLGNCIFALLLFGFALGTRIGRLVPMRLFLAARLLLPPLILVAAIGLLIADAGVGLHFLDGHLVGVDDADPAAVGGGP